MYFCCMFALYLQFYTQLAHPHSNPSKTRSEWLKCPSFPWIFERSHDFTGQGSWHFITNIEHFLPQIKLKKEILPSPSLKKKTHNKKNEKVVASLCCLFWLANIVCFSTWDMFVAQKHPISIKVMIGGMTRPTPWYYGFISLQVSTTLFVCSPPLVYQWIPFILLPKSKKKQFFIDSLSIGSPTFKRCTICTNFLKPHVPGSKLPLFPYSTGWSSTQ